MVKFLCGLMPDPTPLVDHVYQMWINEQLYHTRHKSVLPREMHEEDFFRSLYKESRVKLTGHPLHNQHINYYNHLPEAHRDTTPIYIPSKFYWLRYIKEHIPCGNQPENKAKPDCVMWIEHPSTSVTKALLSTCVRISQNQAVTDLCMSGVRCKGFPEKALYEFNMSECAQSMTMYDCTLPLLTLNHLIHQISGFDQLQIYRIMSKGPRSQSADIGRFHVKMSSHGSQTNIESSVEIKHCDLSYQTQLEFGECTLSSQILNDLMQQINTRQTTRKIIFLGTRLQDVSHLTLNNKKFLSHLDLSGTKLSQEVRQSIYSQLSNLLHLEYIDLSNNNLSQVSSLALCNKSSLRHLNLSDTKLSPEMCQDVCQQLTDLTSLKYLNLSNNNLSQVSSITLINKTLLHHLDLKYTRMSQDLIGSIYQQITHLESLENIYLEGLTIDRTHYSIRNIKLPIEVFGELFQKMLNRFVCLKNIFIKDIHGGCLYSFLPDPHPGLYELQELHLVHSALNTNDLQHLSHITQTNKLPELKDLDLSHNTLTGCLSSFLPDPHPGLPQLKNLDMRSTELNKDDLQHLTLLIQTHRLSGLKYLNLRDSRLCEMEMDVEHLIEACVTHHQRDLWLPVWGQYIF